MTHHHVSSKAHTLDLGATLCIRSQTVQTGDTMTIQMGRSSENAVVESATSFKLCLLLGGQILVCQPWRRGDAELPPGRGTTSNWTVAQVKVAILVPEREPEVAT
jgi:hypothetical protein